MGCLEFTSVFFCEKVIKWTGWMEGVPDFVVQPNMQYADIIVPTLDTVRGSFMIELLLTSQKQV